MFTTMGANTTGPYSTRAWNFVTSTWEPGVPKSSISRSVAGLEEELGVRLIQRTTRKLHLTDAGRQYLERARGAIAELDEATAAVGELGDTPRGTVRISAPFDLSDFLADALSEFSQKHPHIHVDLSLGGRPVDLVAEGFDLALRGAALRDSALMARKIGESDLALFAAPANLRRRGRPRHMREPATHDCVLYRAPLGRTTWRLSGPDGEESVEVTARVSSDEMWFIVRAAVAAWLCTSAGNDSWGAYVRVGLVRVLPKLAVRGGGLNIVFPSSRYLPARVSLLRDFLAVRLKAMMAR